MQDNYGLWNDMVFELIVSEFFFISEDYLLSSLSLLDFCHLPLYLCTNMLLSVLLLCIYNTLYTVLKHHFFIVSFVFDFFFIIRKFFEQTELIIV